MGKETQLLEAATVGNQKKVEQILKGQTSAIKNWISKEKIKEILDPSVEEVPEEATPSLVITDKLTTSAVNVNCTDAHGYTPLLLASLNGHKAVVQTLLRYSAEIQWTDDQGNSALHLASWQTRSEIVDLLLANGAKGEVYNSLGNTPLHYAAQYCPIGKTFTINKLLQAGCNALTQNKAGDTPFDLAVRYDRRDAVLLLVDADPNCIKRTKCLIEACRTGRREVVEILLESGMDPNCFDGTTGSCPLHEALRFFRKDVVTVLLEFGAQPEQMSANNESAVDILKQHPATKQDDFKKLFRHYKGRSIRIPRSVLEKSRRQEADLAVTYPLLKSSSKWLKAQGDHCSAWTQKHPPTCLLDEDPKTYWKIPSAGGHHWVAFDLGSEFTITGVRLFGWAVNQMVYTFMVESSTSMSGPWKHIQKFKAEQTGPSSLDEPPCPQDFGGFYETARYWKLIIAENYGDINTVLGKVKFYGIENGLINWLEALGYMQLFKPLVSKGYSQLSTLALVTEKDISQLFSDQEQQVNFLEAIIPLREKCYPPTNLKWAVAPASKIVQDKLFPEFSVFSDPYTMGDIELIVEGAEVIGDVQRTLQSKDNGFLSKATFKGISLRPAGKYTVQVRSMKNPSEVLVAPEPIEVAPPPIRQSEVGRMFDDFEKMLEV